MFFANLESLSSRLGQPSLRRLNHHKQGIKGIFQT